MSVTDRPDQAPLQPDERAELERLRTEVATLKAAPPPKERRPFRWASLASAVLLVLGILLVPVSIVSVWANNQISNTDRFVATVDPVLADPAVQAVLADRVTDAIMAQVNVQQLAGQAVDALAAQGVPPAVVDRLRGLTGPLAVGTANFVRDKVGELVASPAVVAAGQNALAVAHQQLAAALAGDSSAIQVQGGNTVLDLAPFIDAAKQQLVANGFELAARIPEIHPTIELFPATALVRAQGVYRLLNAVATWLPWLTLALLIGGVMLAARRRRATVVVGVAVMGVMVVLAIALLAVRGYVVGAVAQENAVAAASVYDTLVRFVRAALRTLFVIGLVVAIAAWATGPSRQAVAMRGGISRGIASLRGGALGTRLTGGPVGRWVYEHRTLLRIGLVALAALVVILLNQPSGLDVLIVVLVLLLLLAVVEFLARPAGRESPLPDGGEPVAVSHGSDEPRTSDEGEAR